MTRYNADGDEIILTRFDEGLGTSERECDVCRRDLAHLPFLRIENSDCQEAGCEPEVELCGDCIAQIALFVLSGGNTPRR